MVKFHKIRWTESDIKELKRVVRNYNAKITRLSKKEDYMNLLPDKVVVSQLKELINTRNDYKRELNALKRFLTRGSEEIVEIPDTAYNIRLTKWQKTEITRRVAIINRRRKKRLEELSNIELTSRGERLGYTLGQIGMGKASEISLLPLNAFTKYMNRRDVNKKWQGILRESQSNYFTKRDYLLRENYIKALVENYNEKDIADVIETIRTMDIDLFLKRFQEESGTFEFAYPPNREQYEGYVNVLKSTWVKA